jgi:Amt family ammonium transporter
VSSFDGVTIAQGAIDGNGRQVGLQFAEITAISSYSFVVSCLLLLLMKYIPGLHLRVSDEAEEKGLDLDQFFDEQIGDWSIYNEIERRRYQDAAQTIIGAREHGARSSSDGAVATETKGVTPAEVSV